MKLKKNGKEIATPTVLKNEGNKEGGRLKPSKKKAGGLLKVGGSTCQQPELVTQKTAHKEGCVRKRKHGKAVEIRLGGCLGDGGRH